MAECNDVLRSEDTRNPESESSPLLQHRRPQRPAHRPTASLASLASVNVPKVRNGNGLVLVLCIICFVATSATGFVSLPVTRIMEDLLCHQYYRVQSLEEPIDEHLCKVDSIQTELASILAVAVALDAVVGLVAAFPWGLIADRLGRKLVLSIAVFGQAVSAVIVIVVLYFPNVFPIEAIWAGSSALFIGGGSAITVAMLLSILTDATTDEERGIAFMRTHMAGASGGLLSPSLAAIMMDRTGPWPALWTAVALLGISSIAVFFIPETLPVNKTDQETEPPEPLRDNRFKARVLQTVMSFQESLSILNAPSLRLLLLMSLATQPVLFATLQFMLQFISKRYGIRLSQTGYVQTTYGVGQVINALVIQPGVSKLLISRRLPAGLRARDEHQRDLSLARGSYGILAVGSLVLGLSPSLPGFVCGLLLMALGSGFSSLNRSLMSLYVDPIHRSRLFSLAGMVEIIGSVYAQPMLAGLFTLGLRLGGGWIGLPYYGLAALVALAGLLFLFVRLPETDPDAANDNCGHQD